MDNNCYVPICKIKFCKNFAEPKIQSQYFGKFLFLNAYIMDKFYTLNIKTPIYSN